MTIEFDLPTKDGPTYCFLAHLVNTTTLSETYRVHLKGISKSVFFQNNRPRLQALGSKQAIKWKKTQGYLQDETLIAYICAKLEEAIKGIPAGAPQQQLSLL